MLWVFNQSTFLTLTIIICILLYITHITYMYNKWCTWLSLKTYVILLDDWVIPQNQQSMLQGEIGRVIDIYKLYVYMFSSLLIHIWNNWKNIYNIKMAFLPATYHIDVLQDCKLCNNCDFFKDEMSKFTQNVPLVFHRLVVESLMETFHCVLHSPHHTWFFILFKRNAQFLEGIFNTCKRMDTDVRKKVMEVVQHVIEDR